MIPKPIFEDIISLSNTNHICYSSIVTYMKSAEIETNDFSFVHIVFGYTEKPVLFQVNFLNEIVTTPLNFQELLAKTKSFGDIVYLVTLYWFYKEDETLDWFTETTETNNALSSLFSMSKGKLVYHYQLEQLYSAATNCSIEEAILFRKAINLKRPSAYEKAKKVFLPTGQSIFEVLHQYRIKDFTLYPKIKEALKLYYYINSSKTQ